MAVSAASLMFFGEAETAAAYVMPHGPDMTIGVCLFFLSVVTFLVGTIAFIVGGIGWIGLGGVQRYRP